MIKFQLLSDVHGRWNQSATHPEAQMITAVGDLSDGTEAVPWLGEMGRPVIYVPGNHEYYGGDIGTRLNELRAKAQSTLVSVVDRQTVTAGDVRFLCTTLWTDHQNLDIDLVLHTSKVLNDYKRIGVGAWLANQENAKTYARILAEFEQRGSRYKGIFSEKPEHMNPLIALALHRQALIYLTDELAKPWHGKTIVLTHHAPSLISLMFAGYFTMQNPRGFAKLLSQKSRPYKIGAYANSLEYLFSRNKIELWLHGHLHESLRYTLDGVGVVTNPTGHANEKNTRHDPSLVLCSEEPLRQVKLLCLTLYQSIQIQSELGLLLKRSIMDDGGVAAHAFANFDDLMCFTQIYNHAIEPVLRQSVKDRNRPSFLLEPINFNRAPGGSPNSSGGASSAQRSRAMHDFLATITANEKKTKDWLVALQSLPTLARWTVEGPL